MLWSLLCEAPSFRELLEIQQGKQKVNMAQNVSILPNIYFVLKTTHQEIIVAIWINLVSAFAALYEYRQFRVSDIWNADKQGEREKGRVLNSIWVQNVILIKFYDTLALSLRIIGKSCYLLQHILVIWKLIKFSMLRTNINILLNRQYLLYFIII